MLIRQTVLFIVATLFFQTIMARTNKTPFIREINSLLEMPFFEMVDEIQKYNLASEIKRHVKTKQKDGGFNEKEKITALTALGEYYIGLRDFPKSRQSLSQVDYHSKVFKTLDKNLQARFHQAKGVTLGYITTEKLSSQDAIQAGIQHYAIAEKLFGLDSKYEEEVFRLHFNKARHYLWLDQIDNASDAIQQSKNLLPKVKQHGYKSAYYFVAANIHLEKEEYLQAEAALKKCRFFMNDIFKSQHMPELIEERLALIQKRISTPISQS